jgi:excisionase family DNA binding protein
MATQLLGVAQFALRVSASPWTIRYHVAKGHLKSTRIGKRVLIPDSEIDRIAAEGLPHIPAAVKKVK